MSGASWEACLKLGWESGLTWARFLLRKSRRPRGASPGHLPLFSLVHTHHTAWQTGEPSPSSPSRRALWEMYTNYIHPSYTGRIRQGLTSPSPRLCVIHPWSDGRGSVLVGGSRPSCTGTGSDGRDDRDGRSSVSGVDRVASATTSPGSCLQERVGRARATAP